MWCVCLFSSGWFILLSSFNDVFVITIRFRFNQPNSVCQRQDTRDKFCIRILFIFLTQWKSNKSSVHCVWNEYGCRWIRMINFLLAELIDGWQTSKCSWKMSIFILKCETLIETDTQTSTSDSPPKKKRQIKSELKIESKQSRIMNANLPKPRKN